jgi:hypothetical protein
MASGFAQINISINIDRYGEAAASRKVQPPRRAHFLPGQRRAGCMTLATNTQPIDRPNDAAILAPIWLAPSAAAFK